MSPIATADPHALSRRLGIWADLCLAVTGIYQWDGEMSGGTYRSPIWKKAVLTPDATPPPNRGSR